jgi:putative endonuclease
MSKHTELGTNGEKEALFFLKSYEYKILETNWRLGKHEIDIICAKDDQIIFVEVKTRSSFFLGYPEEAVDARKQKIIKSLAEEYCSINNFEKEIRFDIISIILNNSGKVVNLEHFVDAFY